MQLNQGTFIQALADSKIMGNLESLALKNPKTEKEFEKVFGEKPGIFIKREEYRYANFFHRGQTYEKILYFDDGMYKGMGH